MLVDTGMTLNFENDEFMSTSFGNEDVLSPREQNTYKNVSAENCSISCTPTLISPINSAYHVTVHSPAHILRPS